MTQTLLGVLFFAVIIEVALMSPTNIGEKTATASPAKGSAAIGKHVQQQMQGVHVVETKNESKEWELWADQAIGFKTEGDLSLDQVKASFFGTDGISFLVTGKTGAVKTATKDMTINGKVVTTSSNGYVFHTDSVQYNSRDRILTSPTAVRVNGPRDSLGGHMFIRGESMQADLNKGVVTITKDVKATKRVRKNEDMIVHADQAEVYGKSHEVKFLGQVNIDLHGVHINGPDALFHYKNGTDLPDSIQLTGGVKVQDVNKWATSQRLNINLAKNEFVFDGQPRVVQDNDEVRGDQIVFLDGGKKVQVRNAKVKVSDETIKQKGKNLEPAHD